MLKKQPQLLTYKIVATNAPDTPENRARFKEGIRVLNDVIDELELKRRQAEEREREAS